MEICFENKTANYYNEISYQSKRCVETAESVVPDVYDDIGRILSVQSSVFLKSKDVTARGVSISAEAQATVLYITETQDAVSFVRLSKPFTMDYEIADISADACAQIELRIVNSESRMINPRKLSVTFEIIGDLRCCRQESLSVETTVPEQFCELLHTKLEQAELTLCSFAGEKTFSIGEQFNFPDGKPTPQCLVSEQAKFIVHENQLIGTKVITKGELNISVFYLTEEAAYPVCAEFTTPFSQIMDIGSEHMDICGVSIALSAAYYNITDTINGDKLLDAELHAVMQLSCRSKTMVSYISDAYSNKMPVSLEPHRRVYSTVSERRPMTLTADEQIEVCEDCEDVLAVFMGAVNTQCDSERLYASFDLSILYKTNTGVMTSVQRRVSIEQECEASIQIGDIKLRDLFIRPDAQCINAHVCLELSCCTAEQIELLSHESAVLDEEAAYDLSAYPSVNLVRADGESIWELAKKYHSDIASILSLNDGAGESGAQFLLIPKVI